MALALTVLAVVPWPATPSVLAQDREAMKIRQTAGPYEVGVLMESSNLSLGRVRFIITVDDRASGEPVTGANIVIRTKHQADGTEGWASAFTVPRFPGTYHAQTRFATPGAYLISIEIEGPLGKGTALVESLQIPDVRRFTSGSFVFLGMLLIMVAGATYVWWSATREKKRRASLAISPDERADGPAGESGEGPGNGGRD